MSNSLPTNSELSKILSYLDPSDRDTWVKAGLILGRDYNQDRSVFGIYQNWARGYQGRTAEDERHEHHDFFQGSKSDGAHIGTLIMLAKERGYKPSKPERAEEVSTPALAKAVWKRAPGPVLHKLPESASEDAKKMQATAQLCSRTLLRSLLLGCITESDQAERSEFLVKHKHQLHFYPEDVRTYFDALTQYNITAKNFSYTDFVEWAGLNVPGFDESAMFDITSAQEPISPELYEEFFDKMYKASWRLLSAQLARELSEKLEASSYSEAQDAVNKFTQDTLMGADGLTKYDASKVVSEPHDMMPQIIDPELSARFYVPTGYEEIDHYIYGHRRGEVTIFAAHSGIGKTWFGVDTARLALTRNLRVLFVSTEMDPQSISLRLFCNIAGVESPRPYQAGHAELTETDRIMIKERIDFYQGKSETVDQFIKSSNGFLEIIGKRFGGISIEEIEQAIAVASVIKPLDLVVIDYLQNVNNDHFGDRNTPNYMRVKNTMERLTHMSNQYHCATLALAQLNNPNRKTSSNAAPNLYDIADATAVVRDAAAVLMMYRDENEVAKLKITKSRYGTLSESDLTITRASGSRFSFFDGNAPTLTTAVPNVLSAGI